MINTDHFPVSNGLQIFNNVFKVDYEEWKVFKSRVDRKLRRIDGLMHLKARRLFYKCEVNAHPKFIKRLLERFAVVLGRDVIDCAVAVLKSEPGAISQSRESIQLYPRSRDHLQYDIICY